MSAFSDLGQRLGIAGELFAFLWRAKMWWLMPMVAVLVMIGILITFGTATGIGPFVYTLF